MGKPREVLFYPGGSKTGSSALQTMLRCSVPGLQQAGWNYLGDLREGDWIGPATGNGPTLAMESVRAAGKDPSEHFQRKVLVDPHATDPVELLDQLAPPGERSIIAAEALGMLEAEHWAPLFELLESEGSKAKIVLAVRDLYPLSWARWTQDLKIWDEKRRFVDWGYLEKGGAPLRSIGAFRELSERFPSVLASEDLVFLHYETIRSRLVPTLLEAGGIPPDACDLDAGGSLDRPVNRSLTQAEIALMLKINAEADEFQAAWCGQTMILRPGVRPPRIVLYPEVHDALVDRYSDALEDFNSHLPAGADWRLSVLDPNLTEIEDDDPEAIGSGEARRAIEFLLSFEPAPDLRQLLESMLPPESSLERAGRRLRSVGAALKARAALRASS